MNPMEPENPIRSDPETLDEEELQDSPESDETQGEPDRKKKSGRALKLRKHEGFSVASAKVFHALRTLELLNS
jgi:hypothetical protein